MKIEKINDSKFEKKLCVDLFLTLCFSSIRSETDMMEWLDRDLRESAGGDLGEPFPFSNSDKGSIWDLIDADLKEVMDIGLPSTIIIFIFFPICWMCLHSISKL